MAGNSQPVQYFVQCPELCFYSVAQLFKCSGFDVVLFVCVVCRGVIKGKARTCERVRGGARGGRGAGGKGARVSRCGKVKAKKNVKKKTKSKIFFLKKSVFVLGWLGVQACITQNLYISEHTKIFSLSLQKIKNLCQKIITSTAYTSRMVG